MFNRARSPFLTLCIVSLACGVVVAADPGDRDDPQSRDSNQLISVLQNERDAVPYSSIVTIDPAEELRYRMALASDLRADRIAKQQAAGGDALVSAPRTSSTDFEDVKVTLIQPNLDKRKLESDSDGNLRLSSLMPGLNVIVATGAKTHGVQTMFVKMRGANDPPADDSQLADGGQQSRVMTLVSANEAQVLPVIESYAPSRPSDALGTIEDIKQVVTADDRDFDFQVRLSADNTLAGQLISMMQDSDQKSLADTNVVLFQGGRVVSRALSDELGRFAFGSIAPGIYGIVAAGTAGYAAFSFEAIEEPGFVQRRNQDDLHFVSRMEAAAADVLPVVLVPPPMVPEVVRSIRDQYDALGDGGDSQSLADGGGAEAPFAPEGGGGGGGGSGPGGGGGGGTGGGGGGGGSFAALAAVGGVIAAVASKNNGGLRLPTITSPVTPPLVP